MKRLPYAVGIFLVAAMTFVAAQGGDSSKAVEWLYYGGDQGGMKYSGLTDINAGNLTRLHPELDIQVREALTPKLIQELSEGRLDTAIVALPVSEASLTEVALFSENFLLVRPRKDEGTPVPSREMLREMRLLLLEEGHCFRAQALSFCKMHSGPRELLDANSLSTLVQMVSAGVGVTLIPEMAVAVETRSASVSVARFRS